MSSKLKTKVSTTPRKGRSPAAKKLASKDTVVKSKAEAPETEAKAVTRLSLKRLGDKRIKVLSDENPKRAGSRAFKIFSKYETGQTVVEFVKKGGTLADLKYDTSHGYVEVA